MCEYAWEQSTKRLMIFSVQDWIASCQFPIGYDLLCACERPVRPKMEVRLVQTSLHACPDELNQRLSES
jgi:hypothetical protein